MPVNAFVPQPICYWINTKRENMQQMYWLSSVSLSLSLGLWSVFFCFHSKQNLLLRSPIRVSIENKWPIFGVGIAHYNMAVWHTCNKIWFDVVAIRFWSFCCYTPPKLLHCTHAISWRENPTGSLFHSLLHSHCRILHCICSWKK